MITIGKKPSVTEVAQPLGLLLACHERIRRFSTLAGRLCEPGVDAEDRARTATAVHHYFTVALPLPARDEEESLAPVLLTLPLSAAVRATVVAMCDEHAPLEALIAEAAPVWAAIAADPGGHERHAAVVRRTGDALVTGFAAHLRPEEQVIFPLIVRLTPAQQEQVLKEIRARRELTPANRAAGA
jgi:hypothetical protein